jgi:hypothetical protein
MPFKYEETPLLVDETGKTSGFSKLLKYIKSAQPESWKQKFSFKFRSRTSLLDDALATEIERNYEARRRRVGAQGLASHYWEALPVSGPMHKSINRRAQYRCRKLEARGEKAVPVA